MPITFRQATPADALFIARGFHAAMLMEDVPEERIRVFAEKICSRDDVLYCGRNTLLALSPEGEPVGMVTAYDGRYYREMKLRTFTLVKEIFGEDFLDMDDEADAGEYYIDSLAVLPAFRGQGIGRALLQQAMQQAAVLGIPSITLTVDPDNPRAQRLYASLGFEPAGDIFIFGHSYHKLAAASGLYQRTQRLVGRTAMERIREARVILFGVGGVGSWCAEALIRSGVNHLTIVDSDCVEPSNLNRQLMATVHTLGQPKVEALRQHLLSLNPQADILPLQRLYTAETSADFSLDSYDFIIDCIDSLPHKLHLILTATALPSRPVFLSSMGAARKIEPAAPRVAEFWKVEGCPLARALRTKMKKEGQFPRRKFRCVYAPGVLETSESGGTMMHVTAQFGLTLAGLVLKELATPLQLPPRGGEAAL